MRVLEERGRFEQMLAERDVWMKKNRKKLLERERKRKLREQKAKEKEDRLMRLFQVNLVKVQKEQIKKRATLKQP